MPLFDDDTGNFLSQLLVSTGNMTPGFMARQSNYPAPNMVGTMQPGAAPGPSYDDIQRDAYARAGVPAGGGRRTSLINALGSFADAFAELGGETGGYQPRLDAENERRRQAESDQMAREQFGLKKQQYGLENRKAEFDMTQDQNKVLGLASGILGRALQTQGVEGARRIFGELGNRLGMTPEQFQQELAHFDADPEGYVTALSALGSGEATKYGVGAPVKLINRQTGETRLLQPSSGGGFRTENVPPGFEIAEPLQFIDQGPQTGVYNRQTAQPVAPPIPMGGSPSADQQPNGQGGLEPIPGSKLAEEQATAQAKAAERTAAAQQQAGIVKNSITRAKALAAKNWTTGTFGPYLSMVGGTDARDLKEAVKTIIASTTVDNLMEMRQNSPTGAAVGSPSDKDMALLGALKGSLDQAQSKEQFMQTLAQIETLTDKIINGSPEEQAAARKGSRPKSGPAPTVSNW